MRMKDEKDYVNDSAFSEVDLKRGMEKLSLPLLPPITIMLKKADEILSEIYKKIFLPNNGDFFFFFSYRSLKELFFSTETLLRSKSGKCLQDAVSSLSVFCHFQNKTIRLINVSSLRRAASQP